MIRKLVLVAALVCLVAADVSEVLRRSNGRVAVKSARYGSQLRTNGHKLKARQTESEEAHQFDTVFIEDPVSHDFQAFDAAEESDGSTTFQLHQSHPDYKGPYHYEKPTLENDYLAPIITTHRPHDLAPVIITHKPDVDYLPPHGPRDDFAEDVVKRSIKLRVRG